MTIIRRLTAAFAIVLFAIAPSLEGQQPADVPGEALRVAGDAAVEGDHGDQISLFFRVSSNRCG